MATVDSVWCFEEVDSFDPCLDSIIAQHNKCSPLVKSIAITAYFKGLSQCVGRVLPNIIEMLIESNNAETRVSLIKNFMQVVLYVADKETLIEFFQKHISKIPNLIRHHEALVVYLSDAKTFEKHLALATYLDIKDLVIAVKKGVHCRLVQLAQKFKSELTEMNTFHLLVKAQLNKYEWVCTLTSMQRKIVQYLETGQKRQLNDDEIVDLEILLGIDTLLPTNQNEVLDLLHTYGVIECQMKSKKKHSAVTIKAANLSLHDILTDAELADSLHHCDEIQFLCTETLYIDASLPNSKFAGKNLAIISARIVVMRGNQVIDVSGVHGRSGPALHANHGAKSTHYGSGDHGDNGIHGTPGTSGGNIIICADEIVNSDQLTLRSCGGDGGNGQDGGDGRDGIAKPSKSDNLSRFGGGGGTINFFSMRNFSDEIESYYRQYSRTENDITFLKTDHYTYGKSYDGVQILFGSINEAFACYSFLFSKSIDGESANGGNAGKGGQGGGGGSAGHIDTKKTDGHPNRNHEIVYYNSKGRDGRPGKTGKAGRRAIAQRSKDHLVVDGAMKSVLQYHDYYIDVKPWKRSSKTDELGRGAYYCDQRVSQCYDSGIDDDHIGFFKASNQDITVQSCRAEHGKANEQHQIIAAAVVKPIDQAALQIEYQLFSNQRAVLQDHSSLVQSLESVATSLHENHKELETTQVKQHYKQLQHLNIEFDQNPVDDVDLKAVSKVISKKPEIPLLIGVLDGNSWISKQDEQFLKSDDKPVVEKYAKIKQIVQRQYDDALKRQHGEGFQSSRKVLNMEESTHMYDLIKGIFIPLACIVHFEDCESIKNVFHFLEDVKSGLLPEFGAKVDGLTASVEPVLFKKYYWCILIEAHRRLTESIPYVDLEYQLKSITVHRKICDQKSIEQVDVIYQSYFKSHKQLSIQPFRRSLPPFETSCNAVVPLSTDTKTALEMLMLFINEANETQCHSILYIPNILKAIELEYEAYHWTINDSDLLFAMMYIQDKLDQLLEKTQIEDLFCEGLLEKQNELHNYEGVGYIIYHECSYRIDTVQYSGQAITITLTLSKTSFTERFKQFVRSRETKTHHVMKIYCSDQVSLDDVLIDFPDMLLVSRNDINKLWSEIEKSFLKGGKIPNNEELEIMIETLSFANEIQNEYKYKLTLLLQQACLAYDFPYSVFSFYPPSQWVEQLLLYTMQKQFQDHNFKFATDIKETITGLSQCFDKTLYCILYNQFLQASIEKGENFKVDLMKVLKNIKLIFIDQNLCSLVTKQGIAEAWPDVSAEAVFEDMQEMRLIDSSGVFLPSVTEDIIQFYCASFQLHEKYLTTVYTMQKFIHDLSDKELSFWCHKLSELRLRLSLQDLTDDDSEVCDKMLTHLHQLFRHYGEDEVFDFLALLSSKNEKVPGVILQESIEKCASREWMLRTVVVHVKSHSSIVEALYHLHSYDWEFELNKQCTASEIIESIKSQLSKETLYLIPRLDGIKNKIDDIKKTYDQYSEVCDNLRFIPICEYTPEHIAQWVDSFEKEIATVDKIAFDHALLTEAFAVIQKGINLFYQSVKKIEGAVPRDTQLVASLLFCQDLSAQHGASHGTRLMQQISTGEGKTLILCMVAIYKALLGEKVDIVTSSSVLATRDATNQKPLFDLFKISVAHCCHEDIKKRHQAYEADVIYGDIGSFQRDVLETYFYDREIRTSRGFENLFVDEVDSMLVDKGENMLYLPHALPDMNFLDHIYLEIWSLVNAHNFVGLREEQTQLHFYLNQKIFGSIAPNTFSAVSDITEAQSEEIFQCLINYGIIDREDHCITAPNNIQQIQHAINSVEFVRKNHLEKEVLMIVQQHIEAKPQISTIPETLHLFIKKSLKSWIQSAVHAKYFRENKEYIVDIDHRESACDRYPKIIIMDNETGVEQDSSEWGSGLHQFLQLKHNLRLSTESLKAVYMSNISFFTKHYMNVMGVTGTMGSVEEHALFNKLYEDTQIAAVPTNKPSRLRIEVPVCCSTKENWEAAIDQDIQEKIFEQQRVVLLICEDVEGAMYLHQCLTTRHKNLKPQLYSSSHHEKPEEKGHFESGQLIIATNIAGRGTDIKLSDKVKSQGGLHVCLSYLPPNVRVELQAYGRAARNGDPGSCKMIFYDKEGDLSYAIRRRDLHEANRVADIEIDYFQNIKFQEELFDKFKCLYGNIKSTVKDTPEERHELDFCLDCWAYFLDEFTDAIEFIPKMTTNEEIIAEKKRILQAFEEKVKNKAHGSPSSSRLIQLGHIFMKQAVKCGSKFQDVGNKKDYEKSIAAYRKAVNLNPEDPFARYYLAAVQLNDSFHSKNTMFDEGLSHRRALKQTFYDLIPVFADKIKQCRSQMTMLQLANRYQDQSVTAGEPYFEEQKQHEIEVYSQFISTMQDVTGKELSESFFDYADCGEEGAKVVFQIVQKELSLKKSHVAKNYDHRLKAMLVNQALYYTYESKIRTKIESLRNKSSAVTRDDFVGIFPDKQDFWNLLKKNHLVTTEPVKAEASDQEKIGYWNPTINVSDIRFKNWEIKADSFDWIDGLVLEDRRLTVHHLEKNQVLNHFGRLIDFNLAKPLDLPDSLTLYYKAIKDSLWTHACYDFVLDHLCECAEIDAVDDITDNSSESSTNNPKSISKTMQPSGKSRTVVEILISMNPKANASSAHDIRHIQPTISSGMSSIDCDVFESSSVVEHMPSETMNQKFLQQLTEQNLKITYVSGDGLNCLINAMIQHAKQDYFTPKFPEAKAIRHSLQQRHPNLDVVGMLHCDEKSAEVILSLVNDACSSQIQIVSVVMASSEGPIIYAGTCDKRFTSGQHVVIWQQGNHYVSVVNYEDLFDTGDQHELAIANETEEEIPKLSLKQVQKLERMSIVTKSKKGCYRICKQISDILPILDSNTSEGLSAEEKNHIRGFLRLKLEVDFKTLSNSPRQLPTDQHIVLYDDLCQYAVIKGIKIKKEGNQIDEVCSNQDSFFTRDVLWYTFAKISFDYYCELLNDFLRQKAIKELYEHDLMKLKDFLSEKRVINQIMSCKKKQDDWSGVDILDSVDFLTGDQRKAVKEFVHLMLKLRDSASFIASTLRNQQSSILELDTPEITLKKLADVFDESIQEKGDVLGWFSDNQCDLIIELAEQKWSWKSIFTAISVIAIGVAQIVLGAVLLLVSAGSGSFVANGLISEGVSDMIFGIEGLVRGHCNWSQYWDHKIMSIAITVATAGLGAIFARGKEASRYAYKAFGNASKQLAASTGKQTGRSFGKVMAKQVGKKITKKVAGAVADASINLACEAIVDEMSQAVDNLSDCIISSFDTMCQDKDLQEQLSIFLKKEDPEKAEKYLHQIFLHVSQQNTFLEIWDDIENKVKTGAGVVTQAHGNASKHLQMCNKKLKGKGLMKGIGYVSRFAPLITESVKTGMVQKKMDLLKKSLKRELLQHHIVEHDKESLDDAEIERIKQQEIRSMKQSLSQQVSQRGRTIVTTGLQIVGQELQKHTIKIGKNVVVHQIKGRMDMRRLQQYEQKLRVAKSDENRSMISKYEKKLHKLMSRTRNPKVFARMIEHHDALLGPAFAIPTLEKKIGRPIRIVNEDGEPLLNVQQQHAEGEPVFVTFSPGHGDQSVGHYSVAGKIFSFDDHGNNCLINAVMTGAGVTDFEATKVRSDIAQACLDSKHPCHSYIKSGIAHNYVEIGLVGAGRNWWKGIYPFLFQLGQNTQKFQVNLKQCKKFDSSGTMTLKYMKLDVCHIISSRDINAMIQHDLEMKTPTNMHHLLTLYPTVQEVEKGQSHFRNDSAKDDFVSVFKNDNEYSLRVKKVKEIVQNFEKTGRMEESDHTRLKSLLDSAPANLRLGNASMNRRIGRHMDYNQKEARSRSMHAMFNMCTGFTPPKKNTEGEIVSSYQYGSLKNKIKNNKKLKLL